MPRSSFPNVTDQVVDLLRDGTLAGRWRGTLPGRDQLAGELGVSHTTMEAAMRRLAKEGVPSDAWIVAAGSHEVLEWFSNEAVPVFAFFGGLSRLSVAGIGVRKDIRPVIRQLVDLGHRRIVLLRLSPVVLCAGPRTWPGARTTIARPSPWPASSRVARSGPCRRGGDAVVALPSGNGCF